MLNNCCWPSPISLTGYLGDYSSPAKLEDGYLKSCSIFQHSNSQADRIQNGFDHKELVQEEFNYLHPAATQVS